MPLRTVRPTPLLVVLFLIGLLAPAPSAGAPARPVDTSILPPDLTALFFEATGHNLTGGFLRTWWQNGQLAIFGYPISEEIDEAGHTVQYFERARFEYHPERRGTHDEVQFGHLGRLVTRNRAAEPAFERVDPVSESPERDYFEATGHTLVFAFKRFWERHNGLANFGYPISEEFTEDGRTVQYFERARFEYQPEHAATPQEVQLGHLGWQAARQRDLAVMTAPPRAGAARWTPSLPEEAVLRWRAEREPTWLAAVAAPVAPFQAVVTAPVTEMRRAPTGAADALGLTYARHIVHVVGLATGELVGGDERWYQLTNSGYVPAATVAPFAPPPPARTWPGRWIDVNLSTFLITAYADETPLYSALITAGRDDRTPLGVFYVQRRVRSETMDSASVGIPRGHPEYYLLRNVQFTQYFTWQGHAIHGNYWVHPSRFGRFSSNGCIGLLNADAAWFWEFATFGTPVHIHFE